MAELSGDTQMSLKALFTSFLERRTGTPGHRAFHHNSSRPNWRCRGWPAGGWSSLRQWKSGPRMSLMR
eukprot:15477353-Alexandrium_andersonii.AAC.1